MYDYIKGIIVELNPAYTVLESGTTGFFINISLNTFSALKEGQETKLFVQQIIKEDAHLLFGFVDKPEREIFRHLMLVSGIGANTARMMLSSMSPAEIKQAILTENINVLKSIKGIGLKTAQRVIIDLKDKLSKVETSLPLHQVNTSNHRDEAVAAMVMLGFSKNLVEKAIDKIISEQAGIGIEEIVKLALKRL
jgi:holliday junction DNA helicase RuvA